MPQGPNKDLTKLCLKVRIGMGAGRTSHNNPDFIPRTTFQTFNRLTSDTLYYLTEYVFEEDIPLVIDWASK